jgi:uncharacterized phiE125 gp8 family phage protein
MTLSVISAPAFEPVSLAEAKEWLRLTSADTGHDAVIRMLIKAMREMAENLTHRAFVTRTLKITMEDWPRDAFGRPRFRLPFAPLQGVTSFRYRDTDGTLQTLATDQYDVYTHCEPGLVVPAYQVSWPSIRSQPDALQITFMAGYASGSPSDEAAAQEVLPASLRVWMEARLATLFEQREQLVIGASVAALPRDFTDALLDPLIIGTRLA